MFLYEILPTKHRKHQYEMIRFLTTLEEIDSDRTRIRIDGYVLERVRVGVLNYLGAKIAVR